MLSYVTTDNFSDEVLNADVPVLVDFTAVWCGPCKMLAPVVEELAQEWQGRVKVVKLDVDQHSDIAVQYQVMGVPTLILFKDGAPVHRMTGFKPKARVVREFASHL